MNRFLALSLLSFLAAAIFAAILVSSGCKGAPHALVAYKPTPTEVPVMDVDSAGNLLLRGVTAVAPGAVGTKGDFSVSCRASANRNKDALTVCFTPEVGRSIRDTLRPGQAWKPGE